MTFDELEEHMDSDDGWCVHCKGVTRFGGCEPDARQYNCEECGQNSVYGMKEAACVMCVVPLSDDNEDRYHF